MADRKAASVTAKMKALILLLFAVTPLGPVFADPSDDSTAVAAEHSDSSITPADIAEIDHIIYWPGGSSSAYWISAADSVSEIVGLIDLIEESPSFCYPDQWLTLKAGARRFNFRFNECQLDYWGADSTGTRVTYRMPGKLWAKLCQIRGAR